MRERGEVDHSGGIVGIVALLAWSVGALTCLLAAAWLAFRRGTYVTAHRALLIAMSLTGLWAMSGGLFGPTSAVAALAESGRNLAWIFALYRLFAVDGRYQSMAPVRPMLAAVAFVELLQLAMQTVMVLADHQVLAAAPGFHSATMFRLLVAIGGLVLVHNLYSGASTQARLALRWPAIALAAIWSFDLNYYTIAYLADGIPVLLGSLRGVPTIAAAALLAAGAHDRSGELRFRPSRAVTFQSISLLLIGGYLVAMVGVAQWLTYAGGNFAVWTQLGFVVAASLVAIVAMPSARLRGWLRVTLVKHLFQHRYDYRAEWLRFTRTIGQGGAIAQSGMGSSSLEERVIRAIADITDSPAGMLLTKSEEGCLELAARWQWPTMQVPPRALDQAAIATLERDGYIADIDELRTGRSERSFPLELPEWLLEDPRAWALVPLLHFERLVGVVVLARPPMARRLDWEDFDLLRVAGQQLASYLAEHAGQEALAEASRFDDFHRRIAFVMHDIKNLASQLGLLARNAELHAGNPEFQADMLVTLRNSAEKLNALLARLSRYGAPAVEALEPVRADLIAASAVEHFRNDGRVNLVQSEPCEVCARSEPLEQALLHIVQNALDASKSGAPIFISVSCDGLNGRIEVVDAGEGMSAEFVRSRLFKPFDSSKSGGFGIGAYESRELIRAMNGILDVESREGLGSKFTIRLPLAKTAELTRNLVGTGKASRKVA